MIRQSQPAHWVHDKDVKACGACLDEFTVRKRKHHCRNCGQIFCADCTSRRLTLINLGLKTPSRICEGCYLDLTNEDKRQIAEDLDAKDMMIDSLKRALHQKVVLLDDVKSILSQIVESSQTSTQNGESERVTSGCIDSSQEEESEEDEEDESVESHLKHLQQTFAEMTKALETATATNHRLSQVQEHLKEELNHRDVYIQKIKADYASEISTYKAELDKKEAALQQAKASISTSSTVATDASTQTGYKYKLQAPEDLEASTEDLASPGSIRSQRRARSICDTLSELVCWPIQAMHDVLHPSNGRTLSHTTIAPTLIGDPEGTGSREDCWQNMNLHSPPQHGNCCQRRRKRRTPEPSVLGDRLL